MNLIGFSCLPCSKEKIKIKKAGDDLSELSRNNRSLVSYILDHSFSVSSLLKIFTETVFGSLLTKVTARSLCMVPPVEVKATDQNFRKCPSLFSK
jgi:hypothetical protein